MINKTRYALSIQKQNIFYVLTRNDSQTIAIRFFSIKQGDLEEVIDRFSKFRDFKLSVGKNFSARFSTRQILRNHL
jgi:hypothetical protein